MFFFYIVIVLNTEHCKLKKYHCKFPHQDRCIRNKARHTVLAGCVNKVCVSGSGGGGGGVLDASWFAKLIVNGCIKPP